MCEEAVTVGTCWLLALTVFVLYRVIVAVNIAKTIVIQTRLIIVILSGMNCVPSLQMFYVCVLRDKCAAAGMVPAANNID